VALTWPPPVLLQGAELASSLGQQRFSLRLMPSADLAAEADWFLLDQFLAASGGGGGGRPSHGGGGVPADGLLGSVQQLGGGGAGAPGGGVAGEAAAGMRCVAVTCPLQAGLCVEEESCSEPWQPAAASLGSQSWAQLHACASPLAIIDTDAAAVLQVGDALRPPRAARRGRGQAGHQPTIRSAPAGRPGGRAAHRQRRGDAAAQALAR
jgi:hypothetical protein